MGRHCVADLGIRVAFLGVKPGNERLSIEIGYAADANWGHIAIILALIEVAEFEFEYICLILKSIDRG